MRVVEEGGYEFAFHAFSEGEVSYRVFGYFFEVEEFEHHLEAGGEFFFRDIEEVFVKVEGVYCWEVPPELFFLSEDYADLFYVVYSVFPGGVVEYVHQAGCGVEDA